MTSKLCYRLKKTVKFSAIELTNFKKLYIHMYIGCNSYFFEYVYLPMQELVYILFITYLFAGSITPPMKPTEIRKYVCN